MIEKMIQHNAGVNISKYVNLINYFKNASKSFNSKKAKILLLEEINKFLKDAPDEQYLDTKIALILGLEGACRREELCNIKLVVISDKVSRYEIKLSQTKTNISRNFVVKGLLYNVVKQYALVRPNDTPTSNSFLIVNTGSALSHWPE